MATAAILLILIMSCVHNSNPVIDARPNQCVCMRLLLWAIGAVSRMNISISLLYTASILLVGCNASRRQDPNPPRRPASTGSSHVAAISPNVATFVPRPIIAGSQRYLGYARLPGTPQIAWLRTSGVLDVYDTRTGIWRFGFCNVDGSQDTFDLGTGTWCLGFSNSDGSQDTFNTRNGSWQLGFANNDGSQDAFDMGTGAWQMGFKNSDGSQDTYDTQTGAWQMGFDNGDGTQDTYNTATGEWEFGF